MEHNSVTLANGTTYPCDYLATIPIGMCFIELVGMRLADVADVFSNAANTSTIIYGENILEGYTVLVSIMPEPNNRCKVSLRRAFAGEEA